ncbi:MAG: TRM11 family SAM-dependent methyltransferase [Thermoplasmataceae archaeon]
MVTHKDEYKGKIMLNRVDTFFSRTDLSKSSERKKGLTLFENVQFIYELVLAGMELKALGADFEAKQGLREFDIKNESDILSGQLLKRVAYFNKINGNLTDYAYITQMNVTGSVNQYLTHWIYPYKGKFHPQMVRALINILGLKRGDTLLDPFMGSGTTAVEGQLLGINVEGTDVSPLSVLISKVKTDSMGVLEKIIENQSSIIDALNLLKPQSDVLDLAIDDIIDEKVKNFYKLAKMVAISDNARREREFIESFKRNLNLMLDSIKNYACVTDKLKLTLGETHLTNGDARRLNLGDCSVDGIVTSPPYSIALDYVSNDTHSLEALGLDTTKIRDEFIGVRGVGPERLSLYNGDMAASLKEMYRVLKNGRTIAIVIGNATYRGQEIRTIEYIQKIAKKFGFVEVDNISKIIFGLYNIMKNESILLLKKE